MLNKIDIVEKAFLRKDITKFNVGDTIKVYVKIKEEEKIRLQAYEGIVIKIRGSGLKMTFTARRISYGEGVERTFHLNSPAIDKIEVIKKGKVNRAKIYYLRDKVGKKTKVEEEKKEENVAEANQGQSGL